MKKNPSPVSLFFWLEKCRHLKRASGTAIRDHFCSCSRKRWYSSSTGDFNAILTREKVLELPFPSLRSTTTARRSYLKSCITTAISPSDAIFALGASFQLLFLFLPWLHRKASSLPREKGGKSAKGIFFPRRLSARGGGRRRLIGSLKEGQNRGFVTPLMPQRWTPPLSLSRIKTLRSNLSSFF